VLIEELGCGGMRVVYRARHVTPEDYVVALKVIRPDKLAELPAWYERGREDNGVPGRASSCPRSCGGAGDGAISPALG
jgi:hypothetical protein